MGQGRAWSPGSSGGQCVAAPIKTDDGGLFCTLAPNSNCSLYHTDYLFDTSLIYDVIR